MDCGSEDATAAVIPLVQQKLEERTRQRLRSPDGSRPASNSRVRATIHQATATIEDIRTTQTDPNSTKRFCTGRLKITFPAQVLQEAERARQLESSGSITDLADAADIDRNADAFTADIEYNIQPTDDGQRIYAEIENSAGYLNFYSDVFVAALLRSTIERTRREQDQAAAEQQRIEQEQQREQERAVAEQQAAVLEEARSENRLAEQGINAVWRSIPGDTREQLLGMQRAWIRRKRAECTIESAQVSTIPNEREAARLRCDTRWTNSRIGQLRPYSGGY